MLTRDEELHLKLLIEGTRLPETGMEKHFVRVMRGEASACSPKELEWLQYWKDGSSTPAEADTYRWKYEETVALLNDRERYIQDLREHIDKLESESARLSSLLKSKDNSVEQLSVEVEKLQKWLKHAHATLNKYEPLTKPSDTPAAAGDKKWTFCHRCGGDGGPGGRCTHCGGNGFEPG